MFGRGGHANNHGGNRTYHALLETRAWEYSRLDGRNAKTKLAWEVVHEMKDEGMRFLQRDKKTGSYFEASDDDARRKISQRLRELALDVRKHEESGEEEEDEPTNPLPVKSNEAIELTTPLPLKSDEVTELVNNRHLLKPLLENTSSFSIDDWSSDRAVVCGQLDDLSDCSFPTFVPFTFGIEIDWSQSLGLDFASGTPQGIPSSSYVQEDLFASAPKRTLAVAFPPRMYAHYETSNPTLDQKVGMAKRKRQRTSSSSDSSGGS